MIESTLTFSHPDQIPILLGTRDQHLRRIRDSVGVDVVLRGDSLQLHGNDKQVRQGFAILSELRKIIERHGHLSESEVKEVIDQQRGNGGLGRSSEFGPVLSSVELFQSAKKVTPRTEGQARYVETIRENDLVFCTGPAGCGKTYLAVAMAVHALRHELVKKIVLVRPAVEAGEKLGFLPGDMFAKVNPFLRPLLDALYDMLDFEQVSRYLEKEVVEIVPLAFMRGRTLNNTFMILDEGQNTTVTQMQMFLTRMGTGSRIVVTGDTTQLDLPPNISCGLSDAIERLQGIEGIATVTLTGKDIVRHRLVREIVKAYESDRSLNTKE